MADRLLISLIRRCARSTKLYSERMGWSTDFYCWRHYRLEPWLRPILGLVKQVPEPNGMSTMPTDDPCSGRLYKLELADEASTERSFQAWHRYQAPMIERALERTLDGIERMLGLADSIAAVSDRQAAAERVHRWRRQRVVEHELAAQRTIRYVSYHTIYQGVDVHIDGRIELPSGAHFMLDFSCIGDVALWADEDWSRHNVATGDIAYGQGASRNILLPTQTLFEAAVVEGLIRWYMDRYEFERGHWSVIEQTLPTFDLDVGFFWPEDPDQRRQAQAQVARDQATLERLDQGLDERLGGDGRPSWPRFGRSGGEVEPTTSGDIDDER
jgi:hypothetical protein